MPPDVPSPFAAPERVLVYDGDCSMCQAASRRIVRSARLSDGARASHLSFEGETAMRLDAAGIRNEMAVLAPATGEIRTGLAGILWFLRGTRWGWLAAALDHSGSLALLTPLYRLIAFNRRIIAPPPPRAFACACDPDPAPGYNAAFTVGLTLIAAIGWVAAALFVCDAVGASPARTRVVAAITLASVLGTVSVTAARQPTGNRRAAHVSWILASAAWPCVLLLPIAVWLSLQHASDPSAHPWRVPLWFFAGPVLGLMLAGRSLGRRWHLLRRAAPRDSGA